MSQKLGIAVFICLLFCGRAAAEGVTGPPPSSVGVAVPGQIPGTATNDSANAGNVGQYVQQTVLTGSAVSITDGVTADITSISLTPGDWWACGSFGYFSSATTIITAERGWISTVSATLPTRPNFGAEVILQVTLPVNTAQELPVGCMRISVAVTTTAYLSTRSSFSGGTNAAYGFIGAWRMR